jgi:hypothetical protein
MGFSIIADYNLYTCYKPSFILFKDIKIKNTDRWNKAS